MTLRIAHITPTYLPATRYGGPIVSVHGLCRALSRRGHRIDVYTTNVDGAGDSDVPLGRAVSVDGVNVWYFQCPRLRRLYRAPAMRAALSARINSLDLMHLHSVYLWPTWMASRLATKARLPYVVAPRGMLTADLIQRKNRMLKTTWIRLIERRTLAHSALVHVTSEKERAEIEHLNLPITSFGVVPNGVEPEPFHHSKNHIGQPGMPGDCILYLGRVSWQKGLDTLLKALALVHEARLIVVGNDDEGYQKTLESLAIELGIAHRVEFRGPVLGAGKWPLLAAATVVVLPSLSENFGNVVLEAMAVGTPVVVTAGVGLAETVRRAGAGLVAGGTAEEVASCLRLLLEDPERARKMGEAGRRLVAREFTWDRVAERMESAYLEVLEGRSAHGGTASATSVAV